ncbi:hypothetical protein SAMN05216304_10131 [Bosea sp. OK403]|nr:hypothetical protein SAMN05216304_10131 [Bosea sp. OK403]
MDPGAPLRYGQDDGVVPRINSKARSQRPTLSFIVTHARSSRAM